MGRIMELTKNQPPRMFRVGADQQIQMTDCARIELKPNEQVTFVTESGSEYDVARTEFGFYATPSLNGRLRDSGFHAVLAKNTLGRFYILLIEHGQQDAFEQYVSAEGIQVICRLDDDEVLAQLEQAISRRAD